MKHEKVKASSNFETNGDKLYEQKAQYAEALVGDLQRGENSVHNLHMFIRVWGKTLEELEENCELLERDIEETGTTIRSLSMQQTEAFASALPISGVYTTPQPDYDNFIDQHRFLSIIMAGNNGLQHKNGYFLGA